MFFFKADHYIHNIVQPFSLARPGSSSRSPREEGDTEEEGRRVGGNVFAPFLTHALPFS